MKIEPNELPVKDTILQFIDGLQSFRDVFDDDFTIYKASIHSEKLNNCMDAMYQELLLLYGDQELTKKLKKE